MAITSLLVANRGEIAIRIARAAAELKIRSVAVHSEDDAASRHCAMADAALALPGRGPRAYLDPMRMIEAALSAGCDAVHPGYGFLSENAEFAQMCAEHGLIFVGPSPETLALFGDKGRARAFAEQLGVPLIPGLVGGASLAEMTEFRDRHGAMMIKAVAGGGGRGMRKVEPGDDLAEAYALCAREAEAAFGSGTLYAERLIRRARHIEVQLIGDGAEFIALGDRECSLQRRNQKIIEIAPAPALAGSTRAAILAAAVGMAEAARLSSLATFEFLIDCDADDAIAFIEANPRLQVEHTITEAVSGLDLVQLQLGISGGADLAALGLTGAVGEPCGYAVQLRVNLERIDADGSISGTAGGTLTCYEPPSGPGVRVDGYGYGGYATNPLFDNLIAKLIVHSPAPDPSQAVSRALRAAAEFRIEGVETNLPLLRAILELPGIVQGEATTGFIEAHAGALAARAQALRPIEPVSSTGAVAVAPTLLAEPPPPGAEAICAALRATVVSFEVSEDDLVHGGQTVAVLEAMKMQHLIAAPRTGYVVRIETAVGLTVDEGQVLLFVEPGEASGEIQGEAAVDLEHIRPDLAEAIAFHAVTRDADRPDAVARRRRTGQRTARENLDDLFDPGSFTEVGALAVAAQRQRRSMDDLRLNTPADGIVVGFGAVNGADFDDEKARCVGLAYDYTVLAGTQGQFSHKKTDRILEFAEQWKAPVIWYTEGGGGRPGDVDSAHLRMSALDTDTFTTYARLSGLAPRIAINSGRCFAGNAIFFGCADITIATRNSNIGLGGPAMIEGGGLGVFTPDEIGPSDVLYANGVLDLLVEDEAEGTRAARRLLGIFQGAVPHWRCADQRLLRHLIPENRVRAYAIRDVIRTLADEESWIELRGGYGRTMITGFLRIEGRPFAVIANDPHYLGGAIDSEGAEKGARFLQLADAFGVPVLSLCDTPGFMVGPQSEATAAVRRGSRLFVTATSLTVPFFLVVLRKGYGLGAQAMAGGDFSAADSVMAWPTAEFGPMGFEGAVRLGYRKELAAEPDPIARHALFETLVAKMYEAGKALSVASTVEIDAVIDPSETRDRLLRALKACGMGRKDKHDGRRRPFIDVW